MTSRIVHESRNHRVARIPSDADLTDPPLWLELIAENLPLELADYAQFITWQPEWREGKDGKPGKWTKVPVNPLTGRKAQSNNPRTWAPAALVLGQFSFLGFVFSSTDPYTMLDLDNAIDEHDHIKLWAAEILARFPMAYWERSVSGTGLKGIVRGHVAKNCILKVGDGQVEVFSSGKFTVLTGHCLPESATTIGDSQAALDALVAAHTPTPSTTQTKTTDEALDLDDQVLIERVRRMQRGRVLHDDGDIALYGGDHSAADQALVNLYVLAGATDESQIDRLFRDSELMRAKWNRRDYRERTIAKALADVTPFEGWRSPTNAAPVLPAGPSPQDAVFLSASSNAPTDPCGEVRDELAALRRENAELRRENAELQRRVEVAEHRAETLSQVQSAASGILRNRKMGQERITAIALSYQLANREAAGDPGDDGLYPIPLARIAEAIGASEDTASKHLDKLADAGVARKVVRWEPERIDQETGEIIPGRRRLYVGHACTNVVDFAAAVANLEPEKAKTWGGVRKSCPDHPHAGTVKRWTLHCAAPGCDRILDRGEDPIAPNPQDAEIQTSVVTLLGSRKMRFSQNHADFDTVGTTVAAAWMQGAALPGMEGFQPDRFAEYATGAD